MIKAAEDTAVGGRTSLMAAWRKARRQKLTVIGFFLVLVLVVSAAFAPWIAPHDPYTQSLLHRLAPAGGEFPLGTDHLGRCVLSRLLYGARVSLATGFLVVGVTSLGGLVLGMIAGYYQGALDEIIMRTVDVLLAFPGILLAMVIAGVLGPSHSSIILAMCVVGWTSYARLVRAAVLAAKEEAFVDAARALGASNARIMFREILPNVLDAVVVLATLGVAQVILASAALNFLGLGVQPPVAEWGAMLNAGRPFLRTAPHTTVFPGLAIMVTVLGFNLLGDGLRDAIDPHRTL